jgi:hypothetical protein
MSDVDIRAARPTDLTRVLHLASAFYIEDGFATPVSELRDNLVVLLHTGTARVAVASRQHDIVGFCHHHARHRTRTRHRRRTQRPVRRTCSSANGSRSRTHRRQRRLGPITRLSHPGTRHRAQPRKCRPPLLLLRPSKLHRRAPGRMFRPMAGVFVQRYLAVDSAGGAALSRRRVR